MRVWRQSSGGLAGVRDGRRAVESPCESLSSRARQQRVQERVRGSVEGESEGTGGGSWTKQGRLVDRSCVGAG